MKRRFICIILTALLLLPSFSCASTDGPVPADTAAAAETSPGASADTSPVLTLPPIQPPAVPDTQAEEPMTLPPEPAEAHEWVLESISQKSVSGIPCAGVFRCEECGQTEQRTVTAAGLGAPVVRLEGSIAGVVNERDETMKLTYDDGRRSFTCTARMNVQGSSSKDYPKKNFTIRLSDEAGEKYKVSLRDGWGRHSKYCLKANWVDFSQARNIVSAGLYTQVAAARENLYGLDAAPFLGVTDGFPVGVWVNGVFYGMYTINIPKDDWMFGMEDDESLRQAVLMGADYTECVALRDTTPTPSDGWDLVHCSTADDSWVMPSFNRMVNFLCDTNNTTFRKGISRYVDVDAAIDTLLYVTLLHGLDNRVKNTVYVTYDGKKWIPTVYDMDDTWGMVWNGEDYYAYNDFPFEECSDANLLWSRIWTNFQPEIKARWKELRAGVLSTKNIRLTFREYFDSVPQALYDADAARWPDSPSRLTSNRKQIVSWLQNRVVYLDKLL